MHDPTVSAETPTAHRLYFTDELRNDPRGPQLEDSFFHSLVLRNGTHKTTCHCRLGDLNAVIEPCLPSARPLEIMDVAVSSGVSTIEWLEALARAGVDCRMTAGDAVIDALLVTAGSVRGLLDRTGHLMQLDIGGRAVRMPAPRRRDRLRFAPLSLFMKTAARAFRDRLGPATGSEAGLGSCGPQTLLGLQCRTLKLISPSLAAHPRIEVVEDDILNDRRWPGRFDVLRAANVLNRIYFDDSLLERMLRNLRTRLAPHGLLAVCRTTPEGRNDATVFRLRDDRTFEELTRLNAGSEIAPLALSLPPEAS
jgi:hypothetical protein